MTVPGFDLFLLSARESYYPPTSAELVLILCLFFLFKMKSWWSRLIQGSWFRLVFLELFSRVVFTAAILSGAVYFLFSFPRKRLYRNDGCTVEE